MSQFPRNVPQLFRNFPAIFRNWFRPPRLQSPPPPLLSAHLFSLPIVPINRNTTAGKGVDEGQGAFREKNQDMVLSNMLCLHHQPLGHSCCIDGDNLRNAVGK